MPEAIIACHDTLRRGVLKGLVFRRMHFLHLSAPDGLGDLFNDTFDTFLRSSCFPFDTLLRSSGCFSNLKMASTNHQSQVLSGSEGHLFRR